MYEIRGLSKIIGQEPAKRALSKAILSGQPANSYLFVGRQGTGKMTAAVEFAAALNCENLSGADACGECSACRALAHGNFPDLTVWSPGKVKDTTIEQMREMRSTANFAPIRGKWKVNIIEQGDTLNAEAASCILKLIEEPPTYLVNILLYRNPSAVLPTIRSRCRLVRFTQVDAGELTAGLINGFGVDPVRAGFLASFSEGRPGVAIALSEDEDFFARRDLVIRVAELIASGSPWLALKLAETLQSAAGQNTAVPAVQEDGDDEAPDAENDRQSISEAQRRRRAGTREGSLHSIDLLITWYRDLLASRVGGPNAPIVNTDRREAALAQAARYPDAGALMHALDAIMLARRAIQGNASPQIALEAMIMQLQMTLSDPGLRFAESAGY